jgi:hypothetical protein
MAMGDIRAIERAMAEGRGPGTGKGGIASPVADFFDGILDWYDEKLDEMVFSYPNHFTVVLATTMYTGGAIVRGFVDVLRLGEGVKQGGWGYGHDALRLTAVAGPLAKLGIRALGTIARPLAREAALVDDVQGVLGDPGSGRCAWIASTRALRMLQGEGRLAVMPGSGMWITVEDVARALKLPSDAVQGQSVRGVMQVLQQLGVRHTVTQVQSIDDISAIIRAANGRPVIVAMRGTTNQHATAVNKLTERSRIYGHQMNIYDDVRDAKTGRMNPRADEALYQRAWADQRRAEEALKKVRAEAIRHSHAVMAFWDASAGSVRYVDYFGETSHSLRRGLRWGDDTPFEHILASAQGRFRPKLLDDEVMQEVLGKVVPQYRPTLFVLNEGTVLRDKAKRALDASYHIGFPLGIAANSWIMDRKQGQAATAAPRPRYDTTADPRPTLRTDWLKPGSGGQ